MLVRDICTEIDSALSLPALSWNYTALELAAERINRAFEGPIDTIHLGYPYRLVLRGVNQSPQSVVLKYDPSVKTRLAQKFTPTETESVEDLPAKSLLEPNYPNPFNPSTTIRFTLAEPGLLTLRVFNILGQVVATLMDNEMTEEGMHEVEFSSDIGSGLPSGVYFYQITTPTMTQTRKMLLVR
jgi:hypothetical protein